jgi:hypothetical protein
VAVRIESGRPHISNPLYGSIHPISGGRNGGTSRAIVAAQAGNKRMEQNRIVSTFKRAWKEVAPDFGLRAQALARQPCCREINEERKDKTYPP